MYKKYCRERDPFADINSFTGDQLRETFRFTKFITLFKRNIWLGKVYTRSTFLKVQHFQKCMFLLYIGLTKVIPICKKGKQTKFYIKIYLYNHLFLNIIIKALSYVKTYRLLNLYRLLIKTKLIQLKGSD